jgi:hypothetical protein
LGIHLPSGIVGLIGKFGMMVNAWLALFNLIPIGILHGWKVFVWDRRVYGVALGIAIDVLVMSMMA